MSRKKYDLIVKIGRFQPIHNGHINNIKHCLSISENTLIILGSINQPRTPKNPFTFDERKSMILDVFPHDDIIIKGVVDHKYNNNHWIADINKIVDETCSRLKLVNPKIAIMGYEKDDSSWYLRAFPQWDFISIGGYSQGGGQIIDATKIRDLYFSGDIAFTNGVIHETTQDFLHDFKNTEHFIQVQREKVFYDNYKKQWAFALYPVQFNTCDAVVVQGGHVLLIKRRSYPGKGLWALPGGFINPNETTVDAVIRELREETKIKVPEVVLRSSIKHEKLFDHPDRSLRGRTFTMAYLIELESGDASLPKVKGCDDAFEAKWFTEAQVENMSECLFEDHYSIITYMLKRTK